MPMRLLVCLLSAFILVSACSPQPNQKPQGGSEDKKCQEVPVRHFDQEQQAIQLARKTKGVDDAVAVQIDDQLNVALKVSNFNRLRLKSIRKETFERLEKQFPEAELHVTTDNKLYKELQEMNQKAWTNDKKKACEEKKKLKQIEEMMKG